MRWQVNTARSFVALNLPGYEALRRWKRKRSGYQPDLSNLGSTIVDLRSQADLLKANGLSFAGKAVLEIGSGWFPVVPLLYRCMGARQVVMTDINRYMDQGTLDTARAFVLESLPELAGRLGFDPDQPWLRQGRTFEGLGLVYRAPFEPAGSGIVVDCVTSRTVLEHIPPQELARLSRAWLSLLSPDGFMLHSVDHSDHRQHGDKRLSRIDFLTWSETGWDILTRLGKKQWRLRHPDYHRLFGSAGFDLADEATVTDPKAVDDARRLFLKYPYDSLYTPEELGVLLSHYLLRPRGAALALAAE
ncbi:MAG: class I SAM-dependent methyltransferase [Tistlia sp.]|uniref:class I SAM-dependent methyltransferase n=1 Tax=Tistlia sp. TaxID=3057121 RepID=UPI0034A401FC